MFSNEGYTQDNWPGLFFKKRDVTPKCGVHGDRVPAGPFALGALLLCWFLLLSGAARLLLAILQGEARPLPGGDGGVLSAGSLGLFSSALELEHEWQLCGRVWG